MKRIVTVAAVIVTLEIIAGGLAIAYSRNTPTVPSASTPTAVAVSPPTRAELLALVNAERAKNGVGPLTEDNRLDTSAQFKADDEINNHYFGHMNPITGKHGYEYIGDTGILCVADGENITENTHINDAKHAVDAWIASRPHHAAMIDAKNTLTGFGISGDQIVEHFCQMN